MKLVAVSFVFLFGLGSAAFAESSAVSYLVKKEIAEACNGGEGSIDQAMIIERDLTGDGRDDLIISHEGISCANGMRSTFCGAQVCAFNVYLREGKLLKLEKEMLGISVRVSSDRVPVIRWYAHGGSEQKFRWNGSEFR
jgi:hypothetical protein